MTQLDPALLAILVCPACHGDLEVVTGQEAAQGHGEELACRGECRRAYPVRDGIPVLLVDEARHG